jgi:hypothetical protein
LEIVTFRTVTETAASVSFHEALGSASKARTRPYEWDAYEFIRDNSEGKNQGPQRRHTGRVARTRSAAN